MADSLYPFLSFFGAKWYFAARYPAPKHDMLVEPFAGSAGYAVRHAHLDVVLVERDPVIAAVWRFLVGATPADIRAIPDLPEGGSVDDMDIPQAPRWLVGYWLNKGSTTPSKTASAWMRDPRYSSQFWGPRIRERIARQVPRVSHWTVIEGDYTEAPEVRATWFVDPPYTSQGHRYRYGSEGIDYADLGGWCAARRGQVIVCEQDRAGWLPFEPIGSFKATSGHVGKVSSEVAWIREHCTSDLSLNHYAGMDLARSTP